MIIDKRKRIYKEVMALSLIMFGMVLQSVIRVIDIKAKELTWADKQARIVLTPYVDSCEGAGCWDRLLEEKEAEKKAKEEAKHQEEFERINQAMEEAIKKYFPNNPEYITPIAHCLLKKETNYNLNKGLGDGGKAGGILQFHEPTYKANRQRMIDKGLAVEMGSRFNIENAIDTAVYMWSRGELKQWGPYLRGECK